MQDDFNAGDLDDLVEGAGLGDVGHDDGIQPVLVQIRVGIVDLLGLVLGTNGGHDRVTPREKCLEDMSCCEARIVSWEERLDSEDHDW